MEMASDGFTFTYKKGPLNYNPPPLRQKIPSPSPLIINGLRLRVGSTSKVMKFSVGGIIRPSIAENS